MQKNQVLLDRFGAKVKMLREERGLTQRELANRSGMTDKHVGEIERAATEASITAIVGLANGLQVSVSALMPDMQRSVPESPRLSRAQWQMVYDTTLELYETAGETLDSFDDMERQRPPARPARNRPRKGKSTR